MHCGLDTTSGDCMRMYTWRYATAIGATTWYNITHAVALPDIPEHGGHVQLNPFHSFSATCTYYAVGLTDIYGDDAPPIGLIQSAVGGTQIEAWLDNETLGTCTNESGYNITNGINYGYGLTSLLYYGMVTPFLNMSVAGWAWYQGENNCHGVMGNSLTKSGYGCDQAALVRLWRTKWSASSATDPEAPFGVVSLAAGGSEGVVHGRCGAEAPL
eukprot:m.1453942 g.1453942  ORF g.1453942 m.1453942 type:complete len:214 (-) comp25118_c1_seq6:4685-5326(-)